MYFVGRSARQNAPMYQTIVAHLNPTFAVTGNGSGEVPISVRLASGQQIGNFLRFINQHAQEVWDDVEEDVQRVRFHMRIEGSGYFPMSY